MEWKIYGLQDPDTNEYRYIGKTIQPLFIRLNQHIQAVKRRKKSSCRRAVWIKGLLTDGKKPKISLIEKVSESQWKTREAFWIDFYKWNDLVNTPCMAGVGGNRNRLGVKLEQLIPLLGTLPDSMIARQFGVACATIRYHRHVLEIEPFKQPYDILPNGKKKWHPKNKTGVPLPRHPPPPMGGHNKIDPTPEAIQLLGTLPDYKIGEQFGVGKKVVARWRKEREITPYAEQTGRTGQFKAGDPHPRWGKKG